MKYIAIYENDTLATLTERVGVANIDQLLADNGLIRRPDIGAQWKAKCDEIIATHDEVPYQRKVNILHTFIGDSDIYEMASMSSEDTWKVIDALYAFPDYLRVSETIASAIPDSYQVVGNGEAVKESIYRAVDEMLESSPDHTIDGSIFNSFSTIKDVGLVAPTTFANQRTNPLDWFNVPEDSVVLYSSLTNTYMSIPAYPEELSDSVQANYTQMPELLYQYEPWQIYQSSGPRSVPFEFTLHRDLWTGDHRDGKANELIRFCEAQCYPRYSGSAVHTATVTLYIAGSAFITGIMENVNVKWFGPLGLDGFYLAFNLTFNITEVSPTPLNHQSVLSKPLIG